MPVAKKETTPGASSVGRTHNGNRPSFRTDTAISNNRPGTERVLQRWVPDASDSTDGSLEKSNTGGGAWDQFAENEKLFGVTTDYDENMYTTVINKSHPKYKERVAAADRKAREIERSVAATAHVAEERVMDYVPGSGKDDDNEEDKYSGVRRQDFPPLGGHGSKYTPPAKRAPSGQSTVKGAPVDPAIISSQIKAPNKKQSTPTPEDAQAHAANSGKNGTTSQAGAAQPGEEPAKENKGKEPSGTASSTPDARPTDTANTPNRNSTANSQVVSPQIKEDTPSATSTVERDVLNSFKSFASQQRENAQKVRSSKARADKEVKLTELKKFANSFKLSTPVPSDLVSIIAKDPSRQKEIQAKAIKNAEDVAKSKEEAALKEKASTAKDVEVKQAEQAAPKSSTPDARPPRGPNAAHGAPQGGPGPRHPGHRQQFAQQPYQQFRNNRGGPPHGPAQQQGGSLAQRIRHAEQQKYSQPPSGPQNMVPQDGRAPPTGPANAVDPGFSRRSSAVSSHLSGKLNPNSHEFRPSPFAASFSPGGHPSAGSSPRSAANQVPDPASFAVPASGQLIRRKTKAVDVKKCYILTHIKSIPPPQGRNWDDNGGLRPSYDTLPTWRQLQDDEKADSTMHLTYKEYLERQPFSGASLATPGSSNSVPQMAHHHQLPFHLQAQMGPRQSPHMGHVQMHTPQHGPIPQQPYGHDDHRMVHSSSAQSFASPRLGQAYPNPAQMPYGQVYMGPGAQQMNQYRSFSNNPQYMAPQQGHMGAPMMMQPPFMSGPQGMVGAPQMMYGGAPPQFLPPGAPPQAGPGANGYPSPGRTAAPMMAHQGSQQGQPMYGVSPGMQYSQPTYGGPGQHQHQHPPGGPMSHPRWYGGGNSDMNNGNTGNRHPGTSPQQGHQYLAYRQQRSGSSGHGQGQQQQAIHGNHAARAATAGQKRAAEVPTK